MNSILYKQFYKCIYEFKEIIGNIFFLDLMMEIKFYFYWMGKINKISQSNYIYLIESSIKLNWEYRNLVKSNIIYLR